MCQEIHQAIIQNNFIFWKNCMKKTVLNLFLFGFFASVQASEKSWKQTNTFHRTVQHPRTGKPDDTEISRIMTDGVAVPELNQSRIVEQQKKENKERRSDLTFNYKPQ